MNKLSYDELRAIERSLKLGKRDNTSPILASAALLILGTVGIFARHDWTDWLFVCWAISMIAYFTWRGAKDRATHQRARNIVERAIKTNGVAPTHHYGDA